MRPILLMVLGLTLPTTAWAQISEGWPQFRGPSGQGLVTGAIPTNWNEKSIAWSVPTPGKGWSSPVGLDGLIWMTTSVPVSKDAKAHTLRVMAFEQETGKVRHDIELFRVDNPGFLHARNTLASPSPILEKGKLYAHFGTYGTACIDTTSGSILWKNEELHIDHKTGPASSPILYRDRLICCFDGADEQFVAAMKASNGEVLWKTDRPEAKAKPDESRRAFSTPLAITFEGKDQIVVPGAFCVYSYDPITGEELWRVKYGGFSNVPRPIFAHGLVYVGTGFAPPEMWAIRPDGRGDVSKSHVVWKMRKNAPNIPSPVVVGDLFFMIADSGVATCLKAKTGELVWSERLNSTFSTSLYASGNTIYAFGEEGKTILFEAAEHFKEISRSEIPGRQLAGPAVLDGSLFIRTDKVLMKVR